MLWYAIDELLKEVFLVDRAAVLVAAVLGSEGVRVVGIRRCGLVTSQSSAGLRMELPMRLSLLLKQAELACRRLVFYSLAVGLSAHHRLCVPLIGRTSSVALS